MTGLIPILDPDICACLRDVIDPELGLNIVDLGLVLSAARIGSGLSDAQFGLRMRYENRRRIAPYIGVNWVRRVGRTADFARDDRQPVLDRQIIAGFRIWF